MASFHVVSEIDLQEVENAVNQAQKEVQNRYDFRGSKSRVEWDKKVITIYADDDYKMGAVKDILHKKLIKRGVDIMALKYGDSAQASGMMLRQVGEFVQGIERDTAKKIIKSLKDAKIKVQPQVEDDKIKVSSKSIDTLQEAIAYMKSQDFGIPLQYNNMRS